MLPLLSVIIPYYNHYEQLPRALDSILSQTIKDIEVVIVDDKSNIPCDDILDVYKKSGLNIILVKNEERQYTKESRLIGIESSHGKLITFIDADDIFYKDKSLEYHVQQQVKTNSDIVHFSMLPYEEGRRKDKQPIWATPLCEKLLEGGEIFRTHVQKKTYAHTVWGKIVTRDLWLKCLPFARACSVRRYAEDFFLCSLLFFHARRYYGSSRIGYVYFRGNVAMEGLRKSFGRMSTYYAMLTEFLPYIKRHGADIEICSMMQAHVLSEFRVNMARFVEHVGRNATGDLPPESVVEEALQHAGPDRIVRILMAGILQITR
jgi:glycosyltransferase involved in cell wall biosynthesis